MINVKIYLPLFKLRISFLITFSAVVAFIATEKGSISLDKIAVLAVVMMMASAGSGALNHYFDRDIDLVMGRMRNRPLPTGSIRAQGNVLAVAVLLFLASLLISMKVLNPIVALHLFLGGFVYVVVYTVWLKRRSWLNIIIGGFAGSFAVMAGGASARPEICLPPLLLAMTMFFWTPSHFWSFAIFHKEQYSKANIPMLPVVIGSKRTALYILLNTVLLVAASLSPVALGYMGNIYFAGALGAGLFFLTRNVQLLRDTSKDMAWKNFKASMIYLSVLFLAILIDVSI
jgi:protoheme IX farnesyltransferase